MSIILNIETSNKNCSVSISESGNIIGLEEQYFEQYSHSKYNENFSIQEKNIYCLSKDYYNSLNNNKINLRNNNIYFNAIKFFC